MSLEFMEHPNEATEKGVEELKEDYVRFFNFFRSYNPNLPMGQGMAAEFIMRRDSIEAKRNSLLDEFVNAET